MVMIEKPLSALRNLISGRSVPWCIVRNALSKRTPGLRMADPDSKAIRKNRLRAGDVLASI